MGLDNEVPVHRHSANGAEKNAIPDAPKFGGLPKRRSVSVRAGAETCSFSVTIEVVTPILGGASRTREVDDVDIIRPATVRGHLRFWWRALIDLRVVNVTNHSFSSAA